MLSRRIVASACALCLALPAAATAKDVRYVGHAHHSVQTIAIVATGDTKSDLPGSVPATSAGDTKSDLPGAIAPTPASHNTAVAPQATAQRPAPSDDGTGGWRLAAVIEAAVLGALGLGAALLMTGRRHRAPRMGV